MKLRNKKTGIVVDFDDENEAILRSDFDHIIVFTREKTYTYHSLAELNEEWEDYEPKTINIDKVNELIDKIHPEPLIKDEKIRKAVRAWAEANRTKYVWVSTALKGLDITQDYEHLQLTEYKQSITFEYEADFKSGTYTIAELCGEEEG